MKYVGSEKRQKGSCTCELGPGGVLRQKVQTLEWDGIPLLRASEALTSEERL